jgi:ribonuclease BN (tRNA processing enzyme)
LENRLTIEVLGSGTSIPAADRRPPAYLVRHGDVSVLLECGAGCTSSMAQAGVNLTQLTGIVLTHFHLDHTAELPALLFALSNPAHPPREQDLQIWGPRGTGALLERLESIYGRWVRPRSCELEVTELDDESSFEVGALRWTAAGVEHTAGALAYRVDAPHRSFCFSGDSGPCVALERAAHGVDLLLCECSALEQEELSGHMRASEVGRIAAAAGCGEVVLTHLYDHVVRSRPVARVEEHFDGPVRLAEDGLLLELG